MAPDGPLDFGINTHHAWDGNTVVTHLLDDLEHCQFRMGPRAKGCVKGGDWRMGSPALGGTSGLQLDFFVVDREPEWPLWQDPTGGL